MKFHSTFLKALSATCLAGLIAACGNSTDSTQSTANTNAKTGFALTTRAEVQSTNAYQSSAKTSNGEANTAASPMQARNPAIAPQASAIQLSAPTAAQMAEKSKANKSTFKANRVQVGISRSVAETATAAGTRALLNWSNTAAGGKVAAISFTSAQAKSTRLGLLVSTLPETATVRFYAQGATQVYEVSGKTILDVLAKNLNAGDKSDAARTYWGPMVEGVESTIEIELPAGVATSAVQVALPKLAHAYLSADESAAKFSVSPQTTSFGGAQVCQISVTCINPLPAVSNAVFNYSFIDALDGLMYRCSASFINDSVGSGSLYVLTANHCVDNQTSASTVAPFLFHRSTCDGSSGGSTGYGPRASFLFTNYSTDSTLLQFFPNEYGYNPLNSGALLAGWDTTAQVALIPVTGLHHPRGDAQRISTGEVTSNVIRDPFVIDGFLYSSQSAGTFLEAVFYNGLVEPGSSGSPLFKNFATNPQVIGQLYGASEYELCTSSTTNAPQQALYGRFDKAYADGLSDWLYPVGNKPVARYYNSQSGTHFYTIRASEKSFVRPFPQFVFESEPFKASVEPAAGLNAVHRFYNLNLGVYFYTISESERAWVVANLPQMRYEGIAWYAQPGPGNGAIPLYRFYNTQKGVHFFTVSATERDSVIANLPQMNYENVAYYVLP